MMMMTIKNTITKFLVFKSCPCSAGEPPGPLIMVFFEIFVLKNLKAEVDLAYIFDHFLKNLRNPMKNKRAVSLSNFSTSN